MQSQKNHTEERQETQVDPVEKSEELNFLTNKTHSFLVKDS